MLREDASLAAFYLVSLALGVLIVSVRGSNIDLLHVLFGTVLALDDAALYLVAAITTVSLAVLAVIYRPLVLECFDPHFLRSASALSSPTHLMFLVLVVLNLVSGFQALGTLMAVGIMLLPAVTARFWAEDVSGPDPGRGGKRVCGEPDRASRLLLRERPHRPRHHPSLRHLLSVLSAVRAQKRPHLGPPPAQASRSLTPLKRRSVPS